MTSENEPQADEQTAEQPASGDAAAADDNQTASEPTLADVVQTMRAQQEATAKQVADLTSGLSQLLEKMASMSTAPATPAESSKGAPAAAQEAEPPSPATEEAADEATAPKTTPAAETSVAATPQAAPAQPVAVQPGETPQARPVTPPPVDPAAYAQQVPGSGFPQGTPQAVPPAGFPDPAQPQTPAAGFPPVGQPQAHIPQAQAPQTPVAPAQAPQAPVPQASPIMPAVRETVRAARDLVRGRRAGPAQVGPPQAQQAPQAAQQDNRWRNILFGADLANNEALAALRDRVIGGLLAGERDATGLAGTILLFQAATADRMPQILKDVGEAYYRWNPRTSLGEDPLRSALITWLHRKCESSGVANTIVLVRPGDRFESSRHNAKQRGVEVTQVYGWVVLRDNGKVYTKANVAVK